MSGAGCAGAGATGCYCGCGMISAAMLSSLMHSSGTFCKKRVLWKSVGTGGQTRRSLYKYILFSSLWMKDGVSECLCLGDDCARGAGEQTEPGSGVGWAIKPAESRRPGSLSACHCLGLRARWAMSPLSVPKNGHQQHSEVVKVSNSEILNLIMAWSSFNQGIL